MFILALPQIEELNRGHNENFAMNCGIHIRQLRLRKFRTPTT